MAIVLGEGEEGEGVFGINKRGGVDFGFLRFGGLRGLDCGMRGDDMRFMSLMGFLGL